MQDSNTFIHAHTAAIAGLIQVGIGWHELGFDSEAHFLATQSCAAVCLALVSNNAAIRTGEGFRCNSWYEIVETNLTPRKVNNAAIPVRRDADSAVDRLRYNRWRFFEVDGHFCLPPGDLFAPCFKFHGCEFSVCLFLGQANT